MKTGNHTLIKPYDLRAGRENSGEFYSTLESFTESVLDKSKKDLNEIIKIHSSLSDKNPLSEDILLDMLILGVLWTEYAHLNISQLRHKHFILKKLYTLRKYPRLKIHVDGIRGKLAWKWLKKKYMVKTTIDHENLDKLITFLSATSEFNEEVKRIQKIKINLLKFPSEEINYQLKKIINFAEWFKIEAKKNLGKYTGKTSSFLKKHEDLYKKQEDYFFCGRKESEYHLNMTGAAIMNRSLRKKFDETKEKILLLPTCMCEYENCNAIKINNDLICTHCNPGCHVSMITQKMKQNSVKTILIKHSSSFSKWLKPWSGQSKTGLIGVACVLNLLTGGFEMKRLGIPSQCIFLDFPGCKKHWKTGIPTRLDSLKACNICKKEVSEKMQFCNP